ncbi:SWIM zinc finger family protein [Cupriavidus basilensis]|uniref:SWIM zinc finger family protein n=1 Tax=Cupriavidus basilensis TaxID=68895 RepID=A0ABT6ARI1_9BURK|nr:SWIM zinc finger family protein [Cupriavidus basilensis]MDF3835229.1 SWIM zinc finger family protein [Cupriavidus basilensis]
MKADRADLLELTPEALVALANAGFVKRAQKEMAEGKAPALAQDADGTLHATYADGTRTSLAAGRSLRDAACSCIASGLCRHRILLVLAYQQSCRDGAGAAQPAHDTAAVAGEGARAGLDESTSDSPGGNADRQPAPSSDTVAEAGTPAGGPWSPADFDDAALQAALRPATLRQAVELARARPVAKLAGWRAQAPAPTAHLPMCTVRFFSRHSLGHARCDCQEGGGCAHVALAVWAFRAAAARQPGQTDATVEIVPPEPDGIDAAARLADAQVLRALAAAVDALAGQLWAEGSAQAPLALAPRLGLVRSLAADLGAAWVSADVDALAAQLRDQDSRSARYDPRRLLDALAGLQGRLAAALWAADVADGTGTARQPQPLLPARQILGLGIKGEVTLDHLKLVSLGAAMWADGGHPGAACGAAIAFADPDTMGVVALERSWPKAEAAAPAVPLAQRRIVGNPLGKLAASQVVTRAARRRANGLLEIGSGTRQTNVLPLSPQAWNDLRPPLAFATVASLRRHLAQAAPSCLLPRQAIQHLHVLSVADVAHWGWDAAAQTLHANLMDAEGQCCLLRCRHSSGMPGAVDALAGLLRSAEAGGDPVLRVAGTVRVLGGALEMEPLAVMTQARAVVLAAQAANATTLPAGIAPPPAPHAALAGNALALLAQWLREGLRNQRPTAAERARELSAALARAGLEGTAQRMEAALAGLGGGPGASVAADWWQLVLWLAEVESAALHPVPG